MNIKWIKPALRRIAWTLFFLTLVVCALGGALLHSDSGRLWFVEKSIEQVNASGTIQIQISQLSSKSLGHFRANTVEIVDGDKSLVRINDFKLDWQPWQLLRFRLAVKNLSVDELRIVHYPSKTKATGNGAVSPPDLDELLQSLKKIPRFSVKQVAVNRLVVIDGASGKEVLPTLGLAAEFFHPNPFKYTAELEVASKTDKPAQFGLKLSLETSGLARLKLYFKEAKGGYFQRQVTFLPTDLDMDLDTFIRLKSSKVNLELDALNALLGKDRLKLTGDIEADLLSNRFSARKMELGVNETTHTLDGWLDAEAIDLDLSINQLPVSVSRYWQTYLTEGQVSGQLNVAGPLMAPVLNAVLQLNSRYKEKPIVLDLNTVADAKTINLNQALLQIDNAKVSLAGEIKRPSNDLNLTISSSGLNSELLKELGINGLENLPSFSANLDTRLTGNLSALSLIGDTRLDFQLADEPGILDAKWQVASSTFTLSEAQLELAGQKHPLSARYNWENQGIQANAAIRSFPLVWLTVFNVHLPPNFEAKADVSLDASGSLKQLKANSTLALVGKYQLLPFQLDAEVDLANETLFVKTLDLQSDDQAMLSLKGQVSRENTALKIMTKDLPTRLLTDLGAPPLQTGTIDADLELSTSGRTLDTRGLLAYNSVLSGYDENGVSQSFPARWELELKTLAEEYQFIWRFLPSITQPATLVVKAPKQPYELFVTQLMDGKESIEMPIDAQLKGNFNFQSLAFLLDAELHRLSGSLDLDLVSSGTLAKPNLLGQLKIENTAYENTLTGTTIVQLNCILNAEQLKLTLDACRARDGLNGKLGLNGFVSLSVLGEQGKLDITLSTEKLSLLKRSDIENEVNGELRIVGPLEDIWIKGEIEVSPFSAKIGDFASSAIPQIEVERINSAAGEAAVEEKVLPSSRVNLDIKLLAEKRAFLRGRGLEALLKGQVLITGTAQNVSFQGDFEVVRGEFEVFGKKFNLELGRVQIANTAVGLTIRGVYEKNNQKIIAMLEGTVDKLNLKLSAEPAMAEDEILAFIIFGKRLKEISAVEAFQLAFAVQTLKGGGGGLDPITTTRKALGVDTLKLENESSEEGPGGLNVGVGKYLSDNVYLELEHKADPSKPWRGVLQIELTPNLILESSTAGGSDIEGAAIKWKKDY